MPTFFNTDNGTMVAASEAMVPRYERSANLIRLTPETKERIDRALEFLNEHLVAAGRLRLDERGMPTDPDAVAAVRRAGCAQIKHWLEHGEEADPALAPAVERILHDADLIGWLSEGETPCP